MRSKIIHKASAIVSQCRFFVLPLGLLAILSSYLLAKNYDLLLLFWSSLSFIFIHVFMASVNNTYDVNYDRISVIMSNQNPIVTGDLTLKEAQIINFVTPILAVITSIFAGFYWVVLMLISIILVMLYDLRPVRVKDRTLNIFIPPLYLALPFLFGYVNATSAFIFPQSFLFVFILLFLNGVTAIRHVPDIENDVLMNVHNFTTIYKVEATRILEIIVNMFILIILGVAIFFNYLSLAGLPLLFLSTIFKLSVLTKPQEVLKDAKVWKRFAQLMVVNSIGILLSIAVTFPM